MRTAVTVAAVLALTFTLVASPALADEQIPDEITLSEWVADPVDCTTLTVIERRTITVTQHSPEGTVVTERPDARERPATPAEAATCAPPPAPEPPAPKPEAPKPDPKPEAPTKTRTKPPASPQTPQKPAEAPMPPAPQVGAAQGALTGIVTNPKQGGSNDYHNHKPAGRVADR